MRLTGIRIRNFKGIKDQTLEFKPGFNLLKGENGTGKTSVLDAIALGLSTLATSGNRDNIPHFMRDDVRHEYKRGEGDTITRDFCFPVEIHMAAELPDERKITTWWRQLDTIPDENGANGRIFLGDIRAKIRAEYCDGHMMRGLFATPFAESHINTSGEYKVLNHTIDTFMDAMEPEKQHHFFFDDGTSEPIYAIDNNDEILPLSALSDGYYALIKLAMEIASSMIRLGVPPLDTITETQGVVLIDELERHLHPKWQWRVIDALRTTFPNVQFIAATHAPILFASANDVRLVDLGEEKSRYEWSRYGLDVNSSLTVYQGDYTLPEHIAGLGDATADAIGRKRFGEAKALLWQLEKLLDGNETPLLAELRARYETESWQET